MVVFDSSFLIPLLDENARSDVPQGKVKVQYLLTELMNAKDVVGVPTPALAEFLVKIEPAARNKYLKILTSSARFRIIPFDTLAAVEVAEQIAVAVANGDKRSGVKGDWPKVKFDRQIIAVAQVSGAPRIYSHDPDFKTLVGTGGMQVINLDDLPLPPTGDQLEIDLGEEQDQGGN